MDLAYAHNRRVVGGQPVENSFVHLQVTSVFLGIITVILTPVIALLGYCCYYLILKLRFLSSGLEREVAGVGSLPSGLFWNRHAGSCPSAP